VLLGLLGHWAGERHPAAGFAPGQRTLTRGQMAAEFGRYAGAALVAGALGLASGLPFPYWAQIAAVVPLSAPGRPAQVERGLHRVVGSTLGIITTGFLLSFPAEAWQLVVWVVILQFLAEMYVLRNYALALLFITPLALLMVQLAHPQPVGAMLQARVLETAIGVAVGIGFVIASALSDRRMAARRARLRKQARQRLRERHAIAGRTDVGTFLVGRAGVPGALGPGPRSALGTGARGRSEPTMVDRWHGSGRIPVPCMHAGSRVHPRIQRRRAGQPPPPHRREFRRASASPPARRDAAAGRGQRRRHHHGGSGPPGRPRAPHRPRGLRAGRRHHPRRAPTPGPAPGAHRGRG